MPLIRIDLTEGRSDKEIKNIMDTVQDCSVEAFSVPIRDRYQIVTEHKPGRMILLDTGLGFERSEEAIVIQVFTSP
ncbi:MAG TPA: tautomerase family protein, partial [Zunongwangia profunda]|nr:tautomerase family protein [Zunongwangia profunda]